MKLGPFAPLVLAALLSACGSPIDLERLRQIADDHEGEPPEAAARGVLEDLALPGKGALSGACATSMYEAWGRADASARSAALVDCAAPCTDVASCDAAAPEVVFAGPVAPLRAEMSPADYAAARLLLAPTLPVAAGTDLEARWGALARAVAVGLAAAPGPGEAPGEAPITVRSPGGLAPAAVQAALASVDLAACREKDAAPLAARLVFDPAGAVAAAKLGRTAAAPVTAACVAEALLTARIAPPADGAYAVADVWLAAPAPVEAPPEAAVAKRSAKKEPPLTIETARKVVRRNGGQVKYCYEKALRDAPGLSGRLEVRLVIGAAGTVTQAAATSSNLPKSVNDCVVAKVKRWEFSAPAGGELVVEYPFVFQPG